MKMGHQAPINPRSGVGSVGPLCQVDARIGYGDAEVVADVELVDEAMQVLAGM